MKLLSMYCATSKVSSSWDTCKWRIICGFLCGAWTWIVILRSMMAGFGASSWSSMFTAKSGLGLRTSYILGSAVSVAHSYWPTDTKYSAALRRGLLVLLSSNGDDASFYQRWTHSISKNHHMTSSSIVAWPVQTSNSLIMYGLFCRGRLIGGREYPSTRFREPVWLF